VKGEAPIYMNDFLKLNSEIHERPTRYGKLNIRCPTYKNITEGGRTFLVKTIIEWNKISKTIRETDDFHCFKKKFFHDILEKQKDSNQISSIP